MKLRGTFKPDEKEFYDYFFPNLERKILYIRKIKKGQRYFGDWNCVVAIDSGDGFRDSFYSIDQFEQIKGELKNG